MCSINGTVKNAVIAKINITFIAIFLITPLFFNCLKLNTMYNSANIAEYSVEIVCVNISPIAAIAM